MPLSHWPPVSVVMPVLNEERHLEEAVGRVLDQDYPGDLEVVLAIGPSKDRTQEIADKLAEKDHRISIVPNPTGKTPAALNVGIAHAKHDILVRVDGHGALTDGYITRAVEVLEESGADNVGGVMAAEGRTPTEMAVACAYRSRLGLGASTFHQGGTAGPADTVYLGVFRREVLDRLGGFDEHFVRAQDWELNYRIRAAGETVWFVPDLTVSYRPRPDLKALAKQFYRTGQWRREVVRRYPDTANPRYLAAPIVTVAVALGTVAALVAAFGGPGWLWAGAVAPVGYALGVVAAGLAIGGKLPIRARAWLPAVLATMHLTWGAGFIVGSREAARARAQAERPAT